MKDFTRQQYYRRRKAKVKKKVRDKVIRRDGRCLECGSIENLTVDHVIPKVKGGCNNVKNLITLCEGCNKRKGSKTHQKYVLLAIEQNKQL